MSFALPINKIQVPVSETHSIFHQAVAEASSHEKILLSLKQRKKSNMHLTYPLLGRPLPPKTSPFQDICKYFVSYQNSFVFNRGKKKYFCLHLYHFSPHMIFWATHDTRCTGSTSGSSDVAVLTQDRK